MTTRWITLAAALALLGASLALAACQNHPGYNAYGRYPTTNTTAPSNSADSDTDWYKDRGL